MQDLKELQQQGMSIKAIRKLTGWDRKTIRKSLQQPSALPEYGPRRTAASKLDPFSSHLEERMRGAVWKARGLVREPREHNYTGGYMILTDWLPPNPACACIAAPCIVSGIS